MKTGPQKPVKRPATPPSPSTRHSRWIGAAFFVLGAACAVTVFLVMSRPRPSAVAPAATTAPWGQIEYTTIELERPDESFDTNVLAVPPTRWTFENVTAVDLQRLFTAPDLTESQTRQLVDRRFWVPLTNGWLVFPPRETVVGLSPEARARLYAVLRKSPQNPLCFLPFRLPPSDFQDWVESCKLSSPRKDLIKTLAYTNGGNICLSDFEVVEAQCSLEERKCFAKAISRRRGLMMSLRVTADSDLEALARYWGRGGRMKALKPFLQSLARVPGGASVSVSDFFPEFARARLYTYPDLQANLTAAREDCYWTAMNFMNEKPDHRFFNPESIRAVLNQEYTEIATNWVFGDVLAVTERDGTVPHMCVYVADDVVFTKNGVDALAPWLLMKLPDMLENYTADQPVRLVGYRKKGL